MCYRPEVRRRFLLAFLALAFVLATMDAYLTLRRLRKDRPDLHQRVLTGELSPHGAMLQAAAGVTR